MTFRWLGRGSAASVIRTSLALAAAVALVSAVVATLGAAMVWVIPDFGAGFLDGLTRDASQIGPDAAATTLLRVQLLFSAAAVMAWLIWVMLRRLRGVFATLAAGDPFQPDNARRLQIVGVSLAGVQLLGLVFAELMPGAVDVGSSGIQVGAWLAIGVVFLLAEVFREGAAMRAEIQDLV